MFKLVLVVIILVTLAYMWNSTRIPGKKQKFKFDEDPFKGRHTGPPPKSAPKAVDKGSMTRCHNCSCFFPERQVVQDVVEGHILEFCSETCRHAFHAPRQG